MNAFSSQPGHAGLVAANRLVRVMLVGLAIASCQFAGCNSFQVGTTGYMDRCFCSWRDHVWAKRAYRLRYSNCDCAHPSHYQKGFIAGYSAICNGEDGYVPAMPPRNYWGFAYQSADGQAMIDAWFEGYPEGVRAAQQDGAGQYRDVQFSRMINDAMQQEQMGWDQAEYYQAVEMIEPGPTPAVDAPPGPEVQEGSTSRGGPGLTADQPLPIESPSGFSPPNTPMPISNSSWRGIQ